MSTPGNSRQRILASARNLIYARSYADVGIAAICADAGVTKGSFYHFFPSKRDLTVEVIGEGFSELKRELLDRAFATDIGPMARFERFITLINAYQSKIFEDSGQVPGCQFGNLAAEQATQDEVLRDKVAAVFSHMRAIFRATLDDALATGELKGIDAGATAAAMLAYVEGVILMAKTQNDPGVLERLLPAMLKLRITTGNYDG
jgi:TetR/AcrR family transcriptional repressor of nem operon